MENSHKDAPTQAVPAPKPAQSRRQLFVRSLPPTTTTESLTDYFSQSYPLKHATVVLDPKTKQCKGYGFVTFADSEDAQRAKAELDGADFEGFKIKVEIAEPRSREAKDGKTPRTVDKKETPKLIVRNLPWTIKKPEQLALLFRSYGKIKFVDLPKKDNGRMAGYGFVVIRGRKNSEKALAGVNGKEVDGRTVAVDWAVNKSLWEDLQQKEVSKTEPASEMDIDGSESSFAERRYSGSDVDVEEDDPLQDSEEENAGNKEDAVDEEDKMDDADEEEALDSEEELKTDPSTKADTTMTLFVRNLPFAATDDSLYEHFRQFGAIKYARVVYDPGTERPRGTAFVCFYNSDQGAACLRAAPASTSQSVLESDLADPSGQYTLDGRVLHLSRAVNREEAARLTEEGGRKRDRDKRRLYLLSEGSIPSNSPLYASLPPSEITMREASMKQRKALIQSNPALNMSFTRLSVRNIPRSLDSKGLKALARQAVVGFAADVKAGSREPISKEENERGGEEMKAAEKARKAKGKGVVRQATIIFEGREGGKVSEGSGAGRSRGYGFIEYSSHRWALMGLRWLNGHNIDSSDRKKRLIVEFAIENAQVVMRRREREIKSKGSAPKNATDAAEDHKDQPVASSGKKRKAGKDEKLKDEEDKLAKRQRIIARKRLARKSRRKGAS